MEIAAALLLSAVLAFATPRENKQNQTPVLEAYTSADAYEVYSSILPSQWSYENSQKLLIKAETVTYKMCVTPQGARKKLVAEAIADYARVNQKTWKLEALFSITKHYDLVSSEILEAPFKTAGFDGWSIFKAEHPGSAGWQEFSAVGFSRDHSVAVVYAAHHCGSLCGGGTFSVLEKEDGQWVPVHGEGPSCAWMS